MGRLMTIARPEQTLQGTKRSKKGVAGGKDHSSPKIKKLSRTTDVMFPIPQIYHLKSKQDKVYNGPRDILFNEN